jgi:predicted permease
VSPVTGNFFEVLGSRPVLGRLLTRKDDQAGAAPAAILSYAMWQGRFAGDPRVLGRRIALERGTVFTIVGVAPAGLEFPARTELWIAFSSFGVPEVTPIGRLAPGARAADAAAELSASFRREATSEWRGVEAAAVPVRTLIVGDVSPALRLITTSSALLLLAACLNVSGLLLVRGTARQHEIAVRRALGAGRGRIARMLAIESLPLTAVAALAGAWVGAGVLRMLVALAPPDLPRLEEVRLHGSVVGISLAVAVAAALVSSVVPAVWTWSGIEQALRDTQRTTTGSRRRRTAERALVTVQIGLAVVVLFAAGLLGRTLRQLEAIDPGFEVGHSAIVELSWPDDALPSADRVTAFYERLHEVLAGLPGVAAAAPVNVVPFTGATGGWDGPFEPEHGATPAPVLSMSVVGTSYFDAMNVHLQSGRGFTPDDRQRGVPVAIVSAQAARILWPGRDPIGRRLRLSDPSAEWRTVVGVASDTRYRAMRAAVPTVYLPLSQFSGVAPMMRTLVVRTTTDPATSLGSIRHAIERTDPNVTVVSAVPLGSLLDAELARPRLNAVLVATFGAGAATLAALGLYAMLASVVRERRRELAVRAALGATPARLRAHVLRHGLLLSASGLVFGFAGALATARWLDELLYGITQTDPATVGGIAVLVIGVGVVASYLPARHAARSDALVLLREE